MPPVKRWFAEATNPDKRAGGPADVIDGADLFVGLSGARVMDRRRAGADEPRRDGLRDGQPEPRDHARGGRALRARDRHRPQRLPEPDQQRPLLPGHLPRRARRPRPRHHRGDEDGRRARDRLDRRRRRAARGLRDPERLQPRRRATPSPRRSPTRPRPRAPRRRAAPRSATRAARPRSSEPSGPERRTHSMRITITGASGLIGTQARRRPGAARRRGHEASRSRNGPPDPRATLAGRDAIVHLAGENVAQRWTDEARKAIRESRELGTRTARRGDRAGRRRSRRR